MEENIITRKCDRCKETIYISHGNIDEVIYYGKKTYHRDCFIEICKNRMVNHRKDVSVKWTEIYNNLSQLEISSYKHFEKELNKNAVYLYIKEAYDVTIIPTYVWQKLAGIYDGSFTNSNGVSPEHLLDMWQRKMGFLNKVAEQNASKGKEMDVGQRISYDLSILVNKYDSYLRWLEKQKILAAENEACKQNNTILVKNSVGYKPQIQQTDNDFMDDDISALVDEIFG